MRARSMVVMAVLSACGGAAKTHSSATAPAAMPIAPAPVAQSPATTPPPAPDQPKPAEPDKVAIAEDPDAGGEIAEDPDAGGEATGLGGIGTRGSGSGGGGMGTGKPGGSGYPGLRSKDPVVTLQWGTPTVKGELDPAIVRRVFRRHQNELRVCYEMARLKKPDLRGLLVLKLRINAEGKVIQASASGVHELLETCVASRAKNWLFPKPPQGDVSVGQPITFSPP